MQPAGLAPVLDDRSRYLRSLVVRGLAGGNRGHVGSSLSPIEILRVLYDDVLRHDPKNPGWPERVGQGALHCWLLPPLQA